MHDRIDTFPRLLLHHAALRPNAPATREKDLGIWQTWTWGAGRRRGARARLRPRRAGLQARHAPRDHRRQPAAPLLGDDGGAVAGRHPGADVPGRAGGGIRLRAQRRRDRLRDRRGPGAGRQDARSDAAGAEPEAHLLRRSAGPAQLRGRLERRPAARDRARIRSRASGLLRRRSREGRAAGRVDHALHVGHDRQAQGRVPDARGVHRLGAGRLRVRPARRRRQHALLPADGVGRRPPVLVRAVARGAASRSTAPNRATR